MAGFEDIAINFKGQDYIVKSNKVHGLIAAIEEHVVFFDLVNPQYLKTTSLSKAYHSALKYAGAECTLEEVYCALFEDGKENAISQIEALLSMMIPPEYLRKELEGKTGKKPQKPKKSPFWYVRLTLLLWAITGLVVISFGICIQKNCGGFLKLKCQTSATSGKNYTSFLTND